MGRYRFNKEDIGIVRFQDLAEDLETYISTYVPPEIDPTVDRLTEANIDSACDI